VDEHNEDASRQADQALPPAEGEAAAVGAPEGGGDAAAEQPARKRRRGRRGGRRHRRPQATAEAVAEGETKHEGARAAAEVAGLGLAAGESRAPQPAAPEAGEETEAKPAKRRRRARKKAEEPAAHEFVEPATESPPALPAAGGEEPAAKPRRRRRRKVSEQAQAAETEPSQAEAAKGEAAETAKRPARRKRPGKGSETAEAPARPEAEAGPARRGRSRRRRGGRNEVVDRMGAEGAVQRGSQPEAEAPISEGTAAAFEAEEAAPKGAGRRRVKPVVQAELPEHKEMLVTTRNDELRVALVEDGRLAEVYIERPDKRSYAGNIYRGKVDNVISGMDAAFVEIGLEKNGFLYVDEVMTEDGGEKRSRHITDVLKPAQELLVQVMKDPMGSKGARLTGQLSLAGRYLVYVPGGSGVGVSRRLPDTERDRLRDLCKGLRVKDAGLIVRTVAEGKGVEEMHRDLRYLSRLWSRLKARSTKIKAPSLLYEEADVSLQVARDLYNETFERVLVDDRKQFDKLVSYLEKTAPELADRVQLYEGKQPLFERHGTEEQIFRALERKVLLPSGGNIVIDHAEALTVIDVNTGRYTGGKHLEDTITKTNLEAAREVVRQLRLRDIGGIIIIDFIDMSFARNREAVLAKLQAELDTDRTKTYVVEISPLGLVEMTRQNITDGARGILTRECQCCHGKARVPSEETMARDTVRRVRDVAVKSGSAAFLYEVNHGVAERLARSGWLKPLERETGKRVFFEGSATLPIDTLRLVVEGSLDEVERQRLPVREGQELEVELEHTLTYSPGDAVAHVDGYEIVVTGARQYLGKEKTIRVTTVSRTSALASLAGRKR
jgi:ribonuclease G